MKRKFSRVKEKVPCEFIVKDSGNISSGYIVDISEGGVRVLTETPLVVSSKVLIKINLDTQQRPIESEMLIKWANGLNKYGMSFINLEKAQETRLKEYLSEKIYSKLSISPSLIGVYTSLRNKFKFYSKRAVEIEKYLSEKPEEWGKFQAEFNREINGIFTEVMLFEKEQLTQGREDRVLKLRELFVRKIRNIFQRGTYFDWSLRKPYGYSGDYQIIDYIYQNSPTTTGFDRLFDNYFMMSSICQAVRNRKEDFRKLLLEFLKANAKRPLKIMDLACGPCREIQELFADNGLNKKNISFDCYDNEGAAIDYAQKLLKGIPNINFHKLDVMKLAIPGKETQVIQNKYDLIYSTGLFDYFNNKTCSKIISHLVKMLNKGGVMLIANVRDRYSNPTLHCMEWVTEWKLIYRTDEEFKKVFIDAGFREDQIRVQYEQQGVMIYVIAQNSL